MRAVVARAAVLAGAFTAGVVTARLAGTPRTLRVTGELRRSRARILATREEERRRLRHDLHDDLGPNLASLALTVDAARLTLSSEPEQVGPVLTELRDRLAGAVGEIRDLARSLRPPALDDLGLVTAIETLADGCGERVDVRFDGSPADLPAAVEVAAYRIVAEAVANIRAHARAPSALILLSRADDLHILVADSGVGLPPPARTRGGGLDAMREWAAELGGHCAIGSRPGGGTVVAARLPLAMAG